MATFSLVSAKVVIQEYIIVTKNTYSKVLMAAYWDQEDYYNKVYKFREALKVINQA